MADRNAVIARRTFEALDRQDIGAFTALCDVNVELYRFITPRHDPLLHSAEYALVPLQGLEAIAAWLRGIFDASPGMRFLLEGVDHVGDSVVCDARFSFDDRPPWWWSFVLTMYRGQLVGFEVFHPDTEGPFEHTDRYSVCSGQFRVRGRASEVTAPRPCAWTFFKDERGVPRSMRLYPTMALAREAGGEWAVQKTSSL
jgi:ketosteroid isomerase-like protein